VCLVQSLKGVTSLNMFCAVAGALLFVRIGTEWVWRGSEGRAGELEGFGTRLCWWG